MMSGFIPIQHDKNECCAVVFYSFSIQAADLGNYSCVFRETDAQVTFVVDGMLTCVRFMTVYHHFEVLIQYVWLSFSSGNEGQERQAYSELRWRFSCTRV